MNTFQTVKPEIVFLSDVLQEIARGKIKIPKFQRKFVWKHDDMLDLFDSIKNGYPIGSLFFWETKDKYKALNSLNITTENDFDSYVYVIDGQQRLVTLFLALKNSYEKITQENERYCIYYDLKTETFNHANIHHLPETYFPLSKLLNTIEYIKECKIIQEKFKDDSSKYIEDLDRLVTIFKDYRLSIVKTIGVSLEEAIEIFARLNRQGKRITSLELLEALTYKEGKEEFHLSSRIDGIQENLAEFHFEKINRNILTDIISLRTNKNVNYFKNYREWKNVIAQLKENKIEDTFESVENSVHLTAEFLKKEVGIPNYSFMPYDMQFVFLTEFFANCDNPLKKQKEILKKWFWLTTCQGWFPRASKAQKSKMIDDIRSLAQLKDTEFKFTTLDYNEPALPFPKNYSFGAARVKAFVLFLKSHDFKDIDLENSSKIDTEEIMTKHSSDCITRISRENSRLGNYLFINPTKSPMTKLKQLKEKYEKEKSKITKILESQFLDIGMVNEIIAGKQSFIEKREKLLKKAEFDFMKNKGVVPAKEDSQEIDYLPDNDNAE